MKFTIMAAILATLAAAQPQGLRYHFRRAGNDTMPPFISSSQADPIMTSSGSMAPNSMVTTMTAAAAAAAASTTAVADPPATSDFTTTTSSTLGYTADGTNSSTWAGMSTASSTGSTISSLVNAMASSLMASSNGTTSVQTFTSVVENPTLTYTVGSGSTSSVVTTTLQITQTFTLTSTIFLIPSGSVVSPAPGVFAAGVNGQVDAAASDDITTTITGHTTVTDTITIYPTPTGAPVGGFLPSSGDIAASAMNANDGFDGACGVEWVTVINIMTSTITVTSQPTSAMANSAVDDVASSTSPSMSSSSAAAPILRPGGFFGQFNGTNSTFGMGTGFKTLRTTPFVLPTGM